MVSALFTELGNAGTAFIAFLKSLIESVLTIFYTAGTGGATGTFTTVGTLMLVAMAIGVVYSIIGWFGKLIRRCA